VHANHIENAWAAANERTEARLNRTVTSDESEK
jgi:hypothetical protein